MVPMIVTVMHHVQISMGATTAFAMQVILVMAKTAPTLMSVITMLMTVIITPPALTQLDHGPALVMLVITGMVLTAQILTSVQTIATIVIVMLLVLTPKAPGHVHAIQDTLVMAHHVPILMNAQITDMTAIPMQNARTTLGHGYVLVM
jgi:hypothetical protein